VLSLPVWLGLILLLIMNQVFQPPLSLFWRALLLPAVIVGTMMHPQWLVSRLLETSVVRWIGRLSYSLYLWQQLFLVASPDERPFPFGVLQQPPLNILCVFICAAASFYIVERPMVRLGHRISKRRTEARAHG
jgi:peptidoglycan/LPS O-acetylase OafA/YrhL